MSVRSHLELGESSLRAAIKDLEDKGEKRLLKTGARKAKITPEFVGHSLDVFNGQEYVRVEVTEEMIGKSLGNVLTKRGTPTARVRFISIPPRKMRLVADMVKGMPIEKAIDTLNFIPRIAAAHLAKTLKSAATNLLSVEGTDHLDPEDLYVKNILVDPAPTAKRIRFQSMGRVFRIRKRHCHVAVFLDTVEKVEEELPAKAEKKEAKPKNKATKKAATKKTAKKKTAKKKTAKKTTKKTATKKAATKKATTKQAEAKADTKPAASKTKAAAEDKAARADASAEAKNADTKKADDTASDDDAKTGKE